MCGGAGGGHKSWMGIALLLPPTTAKMQDSTHHNAFMHACTEAYIQNWDGA